MNKGNKNSPNGNSFHLIETIIIGLVWLAPIPLYLVATYFGFEVHIPIVSDAVENLPKVQKDYAFIEGNYNLERANAHTHFYQGILSLHVLFVIVGVIAIFLASPVIGFKPTKDQIKIFNNTKGFLVYSCVFAIAFSLVFIFSTPMAMPGEATRKLVPDTGLAYTIISIYTSFSFFLMYGFFIVGCKIINYRLHKNN